MYSHSPLKDYVMNLTTKKFILVSNIDKHPVKHISAPAIFPRGIRLFLYLLQTLTKKLWISAKELMCGMFGELSERVALPAAPRPGGNPDIRLHQT